MASIASLIEQLEVTAPLSRSSCRVAVTGLPSDGTTFEMVLPWDARPYLVA